MNKLGFLRTGLFFCALAIMPLGIASAQTAQLRMVEGQTSASLTVPMNRAVVVESDQFFAEISIADMPSVNSRSIFIVSSLEFIYAR